MNSDAKGYMPVALPVDHRLVRIFEYCRIPVGGRKIDHQAFALFDGAVPMLHILHGDTAHGYW